MPVMKLLPPWSTSITPRPCYQRTGLMDTFNSTGPPGDRNNDEIRCPTTLSFDKAQLFALDHDQMLLPKHFITCVEPTHQSSTHTSRWNLCSGYFVDNLDHIPEYHLLMVGGYELKGSGGRRHAHLAVSIHAFSTIATLSALRAKR
eukprot:4148855-Amphidinium_carterae.2